MDARADASKSPLLFIRKRHKEMIEEMENKISDMKIKGKEPDRIRIYRLETEFYARYVPWLEDDCTDCQEYYTYPYLPWDYHDTDEEEWRSKNPEAAKDFLVVV